MKHLTKMIALICVIATLFSLSAITSSAKYFSDVSTALNVEYLDAINYMSDNGFMSGIGNSQFGISNNLTRAQKKYLY